MRNGNKPFSLDKVFGLVKYFCAYFLFLFQLASWMINVFLIYILYIYIWNGFHLIILEAKFIQEIYIYHTLYHFPYHTKIFTKYDHALGKMSEKNLLNKVHKSKIRLSENSDIFIDNII